MRGKLVTCVAVLAAVIAGVAGGKLAAGLSGNSAQASSPAPVQAVIPEPVKDIGGKAPGSKASGTGGGAATLSASTVCAGNTAAQHVIVSIAAQHMWLCAGIRLVYHSAVTTGAIDKATGTTKTPRGTFKLLGKYRDVILTPSSGGRIPVRYWLPFKGSEYGFHDASWQKFSYGSAKYKSGGSLGCVHVPLGGLKKLYGWAKIGAVVTIS